MSARMPEVREKQPYALSLLELKKVFVKQGLQQTSNVARTLAVLFQEAHHQPQHDQPTTFTMLQDVQFNTHVCNPNSRLWMSTVSDNDGGRHLTHLTTLPVDSIYAKELGSAYDDALKHDILKLVQYIEVLIAGTRHQILQLFADFVLTTSCRLILVRVSNVRGFPKICFFRLQECAFLAAAAAHPDSNEQLANEVCHLVDMATFRNTIPNLRGVDALIQMRNRLLKELHWFDQQG
ncbi:hypothetical protein DYB25_002018 [Aphanomyces astaci]|uniref:Uncharacterized protein n=1 Tax=Aphanomyces astaci TaxID=112090 RepID=A0A397BR40_APHAT|nr:hypothetical protein DYB25_002018 [Aphanomyces astaci]